ARTLKDSAAEYVKKSKFEKAAEVLEQLVQAEPKDMQHRLRLGDCYRRLNLPQKAIAQYDAAGRSYADLGHLIKAIAAVKVILEIDPRNAEAQKQLAGMNERRLGKATLESAGLPGVKRAAIGRIAPAPPPARGAQRGAMADRIEVPAPDGDADSLELDDSPKSFSPGYSEPSPEVQELPDDAFVELVNRLSYRRYGAGEQILKEGEPGRSFFVIVEGKVRIWKDLPDGQALELATLEEGAFFGEMALLSGAPRTANVSAE